MKSAHLRLLSGPQVPMNDVFTKVKTLGRRVLGYPVIYNANRVSEQQYDKRALLVYLVKPFLLAPDDLKILTHQNLRQCRQLAAALDEFGYIVDVADVKDNRFAIGRHYDLIISHRVDLMLSDSVLAQHPKLVYLSSGLHHEVHNRNMQHRYLALEDRKKCKLNPRQLNTEEMPYVDRAGAIIGFGNAFTLGTWRAPTSVPVHGFNNYEFLENSTPGIGERSTGSSKHFLFYASGPQVGKGLDLLLEIFPQYPDLHLYICSAYEFESDFCACYKKELFSTANIHPLGWIHTHDSRFRRTAQKCAFIVVPTCSEGSIGSVIQGMHARLIPIVTRESGIDTEGFGITLKDDSISTIEKTILEVSAWPEKKIREHSETTLSTAKNKFSEYAFEKRIRQIFSTVLA